MSPWADPIGKVTVHDSFKRACSAARINDFRFHDLRHTFASHLVMAGVDLVTVKELLGHKTIAMTNRYTHLAQEHNAQAVAKTRGSLQRRGDWDAERGRVSRIASGKQRGFDSEVGTKPEHFFSEKGSWTRNLE